MKDTTWEPLKFNSNNMVVHRYIEKTFANQIEGKNAVYKEKLKVEFKRELDKPKWMHELETFNPQYFWLLIKFHRILKFTNKPQMVYDKMFVQNEKYFRSLLNQQCDCREGGEYELVVVERRIFHFSCLPDGYKYFKELCRLEELSLSFIFSFSCYIPKFTTLTLR